VNVISLSLGAALLTWAIRADADWFDRHVLPTYCPRAPSTLVFETCARWSAAFAAALVVLFVRPKLGRWAARRERPRLWYAAARLAGAVSLALVVCDVVLRFRQRPRRLEDDEGLPPMRVDETGNYVPIPSRVKDFAVQGRSVRYELDAEGNRAASVRNASDPRAATLLFTGESITLGWGVAYEESYPALVGRDLGVQSVNLAVTGFSSDQAFLRLREALPRFALPVALVTIVIAPVIVPPRELKGKIPLSGIAGKAVAGSIPATEFGPASRVKIGILLPNAPGNPAGGKLLAS